MRCIRVCQRALPLLCVFGLLAQGDARAAADEAASHRLILPVVMLGSVRESVVHLNNPTDHPLKVDVIYRGMTGTPISGSDIVCDPQALGPREASSLPLSQICPQLGSPDLELVGYLKLLATGDAWPLITAAQTTRVRRAGVASAAFRVEAEPLGSLDIAAPIVIGGLYGANLRPLQVSGLSGEVVGSLPVDQRGVCFLSAPDQGKTLVLSLSDASGQPVFNPIQVKLLDGEMRRVDVFAEAGFGSGRHEDFTVNIYTEPDPSGSFDRNAVVAGCGSEHVVARSLGYRPARTASPADASRRRLVYAESGVSAGPYVTGVPMASLRINGVGRDEKVQLAVFLQPEDLVECNVQHMDVRIEERPWLELQIKNPDGHVVAGGDSAKSAGQFNTGARQTFVRWGNRPWLIEVSVDEAEQATRPWPFPNRRQFGLWGVSCSSAAGMSEPALAVPEGTALAADDF